jgi:hypothetical protein
MICPFTRHNIETFLFRCAIQTSNMIYIHEDLTEQKTVASKKKCGEARE